MTSELTFKQNLSRALNVEKFSSVIKMQIVLRSLPETLDPRIAKSATIRFAKWNEDSLFPRHSEFWYRNNSWETRLGSAIKSRFRDDMVFYCTICKCIGRLPELPDVPSKCGCSQKSKVRPWLFPRLRLRSKTDEALLPSAPSWTTDHWETASVRTSRTPTRTRGRLLLHLSGN